MKFRILALGMDFQESGRRAILCQEVSEDELGFSFLGRQFQWEIQKDSFTNQMEQKLQELVDNKTVLIRPGYKLAEVTRTNPATGEVVKKMILIPE